MEISEYLYESVVEPSYKKSIRADSTHVGHSRENKEVSDLSHTYSAMSESAGKRRRIYSDHPMG